MSASSLEHVIAAARARGLNLNPESARVSEAGLDFYAVFAEDDQGVDWVVRTPRRPDVVIRARHEAKILALVKPHLPVAVPDWRVHDDALIAYPKLAGVPAGEIDPAAQAYVWQIDPQSLSPLLVRSTAEMLAALHALPLEAVARAGLEVPDVAGVRAKLAQQMHEVRREIGVGEALWARWQTWLATESYWPQRSAFIHGDFHPGHMLIDQDERLIGVLDWTEGEVGDPAIDLAMFQMVFGEAALGALLAEYAAAGGRVWPELEAHIAETIAVYPMKIGLFALLSGIDTYREMARAALNP